VRGTVRNSTPVTFGDLRVGIEFTRWDVGAFSRKADAVSNR
jgi:hypothetical protein